MNFNRIWAIILRHLILLKRVPNYFLQLFYWPMINIVIWGSTSVWLQKQTQNNKVMAMVLIAVCLWQIVLRVAIDSGFRISEELLNHNITNIFSTPLKFWQWVTSIMILGAISMIFVVVTGSSLIWLFYDISIFSLGWALPFIVLSLFLAGLTLGLITCGLLIYWGIRAQEFIFLISWFFAPFSAIYSPLSVLPQWVQAIGKWLPMTYAFEAMREKLETGHTPVAMLTHGFILNMVYIAGALAFFSYMFRRSKDKGLARLIP